MSLLDGQKRDVAQTRGDRPTFGLRGTVAVATALLLPFAVWKATNSEPFPAVILPGSPSSVDIVDGTTSITTLTLVGVDRSGSEVRLDPRRFLEPIPVQYLGPLAWESFGQARNPEQLTITLTGVAFSVDGHHATDAERRDARRWLAGRLSELGLASDRITVRYERVTIDVSNGEELSRVLQDEVVIELG